MKINGTCHLLTTSLVDNYTKELDSLIGIITVKGLVICQFDFLKVYFLMSIAQLFTDHCHSHRSHKTGVSVYASR
jgi:hypothetical protein